MNTVAIIDMAIDCFENNRLDEALLHLQHARIHAKKDELTVDRYKQLKSDMSWVNNPDRMGL